MHTGNLESCREEGRGEVCRSDIMDKVRAIFDCRAIVIAKETHQEGGYHYHVGILNKTASKHTAAKKLRKILPEWAGQIVDIKIKFHKAWSSICAYIVKEDKEPIVWGEYNLEQIFEF